MITINDTHSYTAEYSDFSMEINDFEASSSTNMKQHGPIQVRPCRKAVPTLETGRRSKHLVLEGDDAIRRERRRERNREAARKIKEKRQLVEDELNQKLKQLENENTDLLNHLEQLRQRKHNLQETVNNLSIDPLIDLLSNDNQDLTLFFEQYSDDFDLFDETIENILNFNVNNSFNSITHN